jgi:arginyl-tRNA--protein-N-Asp/Glu arginylyltransferase
MLSPARLDTLLSGGWFRSSSTISRLQYLCMDGAVGSVVNIRAKLEAHQMSKSFRKTLAQNKKRFTYLIRKITPIDHPKERLYQQNKEKFDVFVVNSLQTFLYDYSNPNFSIYSTYEVCVFDGEKLIAVSFFDVGLQSVASIIGLYDQDYQQYSLGIFTLLLEIEFAKANGFTCFYPGYIFLSEKGISFQYKLRLDQLQFRNLEGVWLPITQLKEENWIYKRFQENKIVLETHFEKYRIDYQYFLYPYFAIASVVNYCQCVEMPCVFGIRKSIKKNSYAAAIERFLAVEYHIEKKLYRVGHVSILKDMMVNIITENITMSDEIKNSGNYLISPFKYEDILIETTDIEDVISIIKQQIFQFV